jgi:protein-S-isoprenylcysteine O-methyltransferase Ste14
MSDGAPAYGLWFLVIVNVAVFVIFAFSFSRPRTSRDWRSFGAFSAFLVALFAEMYGFPLTIYLLSGWLARRFPGLDLLSHDVGHLWSTLLGWRGDPHLSPMHILSWAAIGGGFVLIMLGFLLQWPTLLTLLMFPILVFMYVRLAQSEEHEALATFGDAYARYIAAVPGFIPRLGPPTTSPQRESENLPPPPIRP